MSFLFGVNQQFHSRLAFWPTLPLQTLWPYFFENFSQQYDENFQRLNISSRQHGNYKPKPELGQSFPGNCRKIHLQRLLLRRKKPQKSKKVLLSF
jgi:hypothetical protein